MNAWSVAVNDLFWELIDVFHNRELKMMRLV